MFVEKRPAEPKPYKHAGWIISVIGFIALIATPVLLWNQLPHVRSVLVTIFLVSALFHIVLGKAIRDHKRWARTAGIVWSIIALVSPLAILGGYGLWCLTSGWKNPEKTEDEEIGTAATPAVR